jgi:hypothetical protein
MTRHRRARRFPITTSLVFRELGESQWREASTINVSYSGVLFRAEGAPPGAAHAVEIVLSLPLNGVTPAPLVRCTGHVVRIAPEDLAGEGHAVAVSIDGYVFEGRLPV